ncbi:MAG: hypothetical protein NTV62_01360 [Candidatus Gribaldobacteria bacterium]|nr:hypothetical protein [Candidatus Gribaldobacteria bacterium]
MKVGLKWLSLIIRSKNVQSNLAEDNYKKEAAKMAKYNLSFTAPREEPAFKKVKLVLNQFGIDSDDIVTGDVVCFSIKTNKFGVNNLASTLKKAGAQNVTVMVYKKSLFFLSKSKKVTTDTHKPWWKKIIRDLNLFAEVILKKIENLIEKSATIRVGFTNPTKFLGHIAAIIVLVGLIAISAWPIKPNDNGMIVKTRYVAKRAITGNEKGAPVIKVQKPAKALKTKRPPPDTKPVETNLNKQKEKSVLVADKRPASVPMKFPKIQNTPPDTKSADQKKQEFIYPLWYTQEVKKEKQNEK